MKKSINKIFKNLSLFLIFLTLLSFVMLIFVNQQNVSYEKMKNLSSQKEIIYKLISLEKDDLESAIIKVNGEVVKLNYMINELEELYKSNFFESQIIGNSKEYKSDLKTLKKLSSDFSNFVKKLYEKAAKKQKTNEDEMQMLIAYENLKAFLDDMMFKDIEYKENKIALIQYITLGIFIVMIFVTFWYSRRLKAINKDIFYLYAIENNKADYKIFSEEVDAICMRMKHKPKATAVNASLIDPVTNIYNSRGLFNSYSEKKDLKDDNFTAVTMFEIENFSKSSREFTQEFIQSILKKVAFMLTLHEQAADTIARTSYNQFVIIFSRPSKSEAFKDMEMIHKSISEISLKTVNGSVVPAEINGGFVIKPNNKRLEDSLQKAKEILEYARAKNANAILQVKDLAEDEY